MELMLKTATIGLEAYLRRTNDVLLLPVKKHDEKKKLFSIAKEASKFQKELEMTQLDIEANESVITYAQRIKMKAKKQGHQQLHIKWNEKLMHSKYPRRTRESDVDQKKTNQWLKSSGLKAETEGLIIAAQDQSLATRSYHHRIIKDGTSPTCRVCGKFEETINHIISGCPELAKTDYIYRHDKAAKYIHWQICRSFNIDTSNKWYEHEPNAVTENSNVTILWDMPIHTDKEIRANRPDIVVKLKNERQCFLIDMSVPSDDNTSVKLMEKLSKYKDLEIEISKMWHMKTETLPVIIGALGVIKKGLEKYTEKIPGNVCIYELQKITLLGTAHILRRVLSIK